MAFSNFRTVKNKKGEFLQCTVRFTCRDSDLDTVRNYDFYYDDDTIRKFILSAMQKAVDNRDVFEYIMFDDVDDFRCVRNLIKEGRQNAT